MLSKLLDEAYWTNFSWWKEELLKNSSGPTDKVLLDQCLGDKVGFFIDHELLQYVTNRPYGCDKDMIDSLDEFVKIYGFDLICEDLGLQLLNNFRDLWSQKEAERELQLIHDFLKEEKDVQEVLKVYALYSELNKEFLND